MSGHRTQASRITINDLLPLTDCCVSVYAENVCNSVIHSGPVVSVCGHTSDGKPPPVQSLSINAISDHSLYVVWEPPVNYSRPGLRYSVNINGQTSSVLDRTYFFISTGLLPNTSYTVEVQAISTVSTSNPNYATNTTKPSFPVPPMNVCFSSHSSNDLPVLEWDSVPGVTHYVVFWQCNEINDNVTTESTSLTINDNLFQDPYTWCTARVQSVNEIGFSDLSNPTSTVTPKLVPSQPVCFLIDERGSSAVFSFTVTDPFSLHQLDVDWKLNTSSTTVELSKRSSFENSTLIVPVRRNTDYTFILRLCNVQGCGNYCPTIMFTTNTVSQHLSAMGGLSVQV